MRGASVTKKRILCMAGTRPEAIKMAPVVKALRSTDWAEVVLVASGQHRELADSAFAAFGLKPDIDLAVMTEHQTLASLTGRLFQLLEPALNDIAPDLVIAQGDTTTVMVAATACFYLGIPFAHLEAGLRTGNLKSPFPEEFNRVLCGHLATLHFSPTQIAREALISEGIDAHRVVLCGNTVIDALLATAGSPPKEIKPGCKLILMTAHRRENFGPPLEQVFRAVRDVLHARSDTELLFPVHPNPKVGQMARQIFANVPRATLCAPLGYEAFVGAMRSAHIIISDSGGVQEEAPALCKPVLVTRDTTERPEAVSVGAAKLVGTDYGMVRAALESLIEDDDAYNVMARGVSPYGDGKASARIVDALEVFFGRRPHRNLADFDADISGPKVGD